MRFSSYNWPHRNERGWVIGPWFGRLVYVTVKQIQIAESPDD